MNETCIAFNDDFKAKISKIKETGIHLKLDNPKINYILEVQAEIRQYLKAEYPELVRRMPETFATFICLIVDITHFSSWDDFDVPCLYAKIPYLYEEICDCSCCCGHLVQACNTTIVESNGLYLALGDVCIEKYRIVHETAELLRKKRNRKKGIPKPSKDFKMKFDDVKEELWDKLHCSICSKYCPKFKQCWQCKMKTQDKCKCGKYKQKKYPKCYGCYQRP